MEETYTLLVHVYCLLYLAITVIHADAITLSVIPTVIYGSRQRLICRQDGWWGISNTTFYRDGEKFAKIRRGSSGSCIFERLKSSINEDDFQKRCSWTTRTLIIYKVDDGYNNTIWHCESRGEKSNKYTMKVQDLSPCNFKVSISGNVSNIVEGENLHLTCNSDYDDGDHKYFWKIYYNNGLSSNNRAKEITQLTSRSDTGMYSCQIKKEDCRSEAQIYINVQYHPNVTIYSQPSISTINMTCLGEGYPDNFTFYGWHHYINGQLVRVLKGKESLGSSILIVEGVTALDNGKYECLVSNGIPDVGGNLNSSAEHTIYLPATPLALQNKIEEIVINKEDVNLKSVFLVEDVTSVTLIEPSKTHTKLNISDVIKEEFQNIKVYGTTVNLSVIVVQYSIPNVTNEGHYYFNVCNMRQLCDVSSGYKITFKSEESLPGMIDQEELDQNLPVILGAVAGVVVIIVIVIIIVVVVCRRSSTSDSNNTNYADLDFRHPNPVYTDLQSGT